MSNITILNVHPKIASVLYSADRWESNEKKKIGLREVMLLLQIDIFLQIKSIKVVRLLILKREAFIKWLDEMEYMVFKITRPDITLYLSLPIDIILKLIDKRNGKMKRVYLKK